MAKQYGLIVPNKEKSVLKRPSIFDEDSDSDGSVPTGLKKPLKKQHKITQNKAIEEDPTVFQYDEIYDEMDQKRKESKLSRKDLDRKPKYISRLLAAADRRKKENERRIERQVQKERETEGDEFKSKESFVTSSYKKKLEEMKEMEEQERREDYLEAIGDVTKQGNLDGFYRHLYDQKVNYEEKDAQKEEKTVAERKYRKHKESESEAEDDDDEETKKEHIPSNLDADSDFSIDSSDSEDEKDKKTDEEKPKTEETNQEEPKEKEEEKSKTDPAQAPPPPEKPKLDIWKKRTVGEVFDSALQRYFERKSLREL